MSTPPTLRDFQEMLMRLPRAALVTLRLVSDSGEYVAVHTRKTAQMHLDALRTRDLSEPLEVTLHPASVDVVESPGA